MMIVLSSSVVLLMQWYNEVNQYHDIERQNAYHWQKYMNEEEFAQVEPGMSYLDIVKLAKGEGERVTDQVYRWKDELLLTQSYELHFRDGKLEAKKVIKNRGYSTRIHSK